jgi:hypothetical protein
VRKDYVDAATALNVLKAGDTMTGTLQVRPPSGPALVVACALHVGFNAATNNGISVRQSADSTASFLAFYNAAGTSIGSINGTSAATAYNTSSDMRLKTSIEAFDAGRIVDDTEVFSFKWKAGGEERSYGVSAQQAQEVFPQAVTYIEQDDWYGIDYSKYIPVVLNELKALRRRVAELEEKLNAKPS